MRPIEVASSCWRNYAAVAAPGLVSPASGRLIPTIAIETLAVMIDRPVG
jgi:hypothetical protein